MRWPAFTVQYVHSRCYITSLHPPPTSPFGSAPRHNIHCAMKPTVMTTTNVAACNPFSIYDTIALCAITASYYPQRPARASLRTITRCMYGPPVIYGWANTNGNASAIGKGYSPSQTRGSGTADIYAIHEYNPYPWMQCIRGYEYDEALTHPRAAV